MVVSLSLLLLFLSSCVQPELLNQYADLTQILIAYPEKTGNPQEENKYLNALIFLERKQSLEDL